MGASAPPVFFMKRRIATIQLTSPHGGARAHEGARVDAFLLATLAESLDAFGISASWELIGGDRDSESEGVVWLDVSGVGHLHGSETLLARALLEHTVQLTTPRPVTQRPVTQRSVTQRPVTQLPVTAERLNGSLGSDGGEFGLRVVIASGPRVGRLLTAGLSSWGPKPAASQPHFAFAVAEKDTARLLGALPVELLLGADAAFWRRIGIVTLEQLLALPLATVTARLGPRAPEILDLARGEDRKPLAPHHPPRTIELEHEWDEASEGLEPLRFVLRGIFDRVGGRLAARGEGATRLTLRFDWQVEFGKTAAFVQEFSLPAPLQDGREFERITFARLERLTLPGPVFRVTATAMGLAAKQGFQLELSADPRGARRQIAADLELPLLVTELESELGAEVVGCLSELSSHCPEERSELVPFGRGRDASEKARTRSPRSSKGGSTKGGSTKQGPSKQPSSSRAVSPLDGVTRLLPRPVLLALPPTEGGLLELGERVYRVRRLRFLQRLAEIRWWTQQGTSRDYFWMWLEPLAGRGARPEELRTECALVYADRRTARRGERSSGAEGGMRYYLQGFGRPGLLDD